MTDTIYKVIWKEKARNHLKTISYTLALKLEEKVNTYLVQFPKELGKPLVGKYKGLYRYRYGDYRVLYEIDSEHKLVIINRIGHRSDVY
jgi:mRNA interferase RelE/StbE